MPNNGSAATSSTGANPTASTAGTPAGSSTRLGTATARPYTPTIRPRSAGGARCPTTALPVTVRMPKPTPRTTEQARIQVSVSATTRAAPAAISTRPSAMVRPWPRVRSVHGTASWATTVVASSTPLTSPAPAAPAPPWTAHSGATGSSRAYPEKPVTE